MDAKTLWPVIRHALLYGGVLSAVVSVLLLGLLWINPEILLNDYPPDIQKKHGPMSERSKRQRVPVAIGIGAVALSIVTASFSAIRANGEGTISFLAAFVHLFVMLSVFNVVDLLVLDWLLVAIGPTTNTGPGGTGMSVRIRGYGEWTIGADGLIAESKGHYDDADYQCQLKVGAPPAP